MGAKGPKAIVSYTEWLRRTSLTLKKRSADTQKVDAAYRNWSVTPNSYPAAWELYQSLAEYLAAKGGNWSRVERDKVSGGLIEWVFQQVQKVPGVLPPPPSKAQAALQNTDIPHSRYGVLYLLGNISIDMSMMAISLEGVAALGNAVGSGLSTHFDHLDNAKLASRTVNVMGQSVDTRHISSAGALAVKTAGNKLGGTTDPATRPRQHLVAPVARRAEPGFPLTLAMYEIVKEDPILMLNPFMLGGTLVATAGAAVIDALNSLRIVLQNAVSDLAHYILQQVANPSAKSLATLGATIKGMVKFVVAKCMVSAAPLVGGVLDLAGGLVKTIRAAKERIGVWLLRRQIVINPGHPELLANSIESQLTQGVFAGLWTILKGVANTALTVFLPGASSLVSALVTGIEWLVKFAWRLIEQFQINKFLEEARKRFLEVRARATRVETTGVRNYTDSMGRAQRISEQYVRYEPDLDRSKGGLIHDLEDFTRFFQKGCDASPLIPMLVLNSGICGSLMVLLKMFDDLNRPLTTQKVYDAGNEYFRRLKEFSRNYLAGSGFEIKVRPSDDGTSYEPSSAQNRERRFLQGLLNHSLRDHFKAETKADKAVAFFAA
ncbi:MAG: hypothetical protein KF796_16495 [Ramlibacter sp.]|nr:hypothetical protein [Ramlibacter sp.]